MKRKSIIRILVILCISIILPLTSGCQKEEKAESKVVKYWNENATGEEMLVGESKQLELYFQPQTSYFRVKNKDTGYSWYSNPSEADQDEKANNTNKALLKSTLIINYCDDKGVIQTLDNYTYSIKNQQFIYEEIDNGVRVKYTIGDLEDEKLLLPQAITKERFDQVFASKLSKSDMSLMGKRYKLLDLMALDNKEKNLYLEQYPIIEEQPIYIARTGINKLPDYLDERLEDSIRKSGYTKDDLAYDKELVGVSQGNDTLFNVTLEYALEGEGLNVRMPSSEIYYPEKNVITDISVLEYFGASKEDEGFLFVPDGAGALINFNNGRLKADKYVSQVYGEDPIIHKLEQLGKNEPVRFPVYGVQHKEGGFISIIEDGEAFASVQADIGGRIHSYNYVNAKFNIIPNKVSSVNSGFRYYQSHIWDGVFQLKYLFLHNNESGYVDMAKTYQRYLKDKDVLSKKTDDSKTFIVEALGAIKTNKQFMGVPYEGKTIMTSYDDALELLAHLKTGGVNNISLQFMDVEGNGIDTNTTSVEVSKAMGGPRSFDKLYAYTRAEDIDFSVGLNLTEIKDDQIFDGYKENRDAVRNLDSTVAAVKPYSPIYFISEFRAIPSYFIRPDQFVERLDKVWATKNDSYELDMTFDNIGKMVYSDFNEKRTITRQDAVFWQEEILKEAANKGQKVNIHGGNAYTLPYVTTITELPLSSSNYNIFDKSVPFVQIVLHGYKSYAGEPINLAQDYTINMLKTVELGADLYYKWVVQDTSHIKESTHDELYSVGFQNWIMEGVQLYHELDEQLKGTNNQEIADHEEIMEDVTKTTYESGTYVIVNYRNSSIEIDGVRIKSKSYYIHP